MVEKGIACAILAVFFTGTGLASPILYSNIPATLPPGGPSDGFAGNGITSIGSLMQFAGPVQAYNLDTFTAVLSTAALQSDFPGQGTSSGWAATVTVDFNNVGVGDSLGSFIGSSTEVVTIPWRPTGNSGCPTVNGVQGRTPVGSVTCYTNDLVSVTLGVAGITSASNNVIATVVLPSTSGPYSDLGVALTAATASIGSNPVALLYQGGVPASSGSYYAFESVTGSAATVGSVSSSVPEPETGRAVGLAFIFIAIAAAIRSKRNKS